jgi:hypothetical protein
MHRCNGAFEYFGEILQVEAAVSSSTLAKSRRTSNTLGVNDPDTHIEFVA